MKMVRLLPAMLALSVATACASAAPPAAPAATAAASTDEYQLGAGDKLRITVFGEERLTGEYAVTGDGLIAFPLIGNVQAGGTTLLQLEDAIRTKLAAGYLKDPRVSVEPLTYRPFYILGEVNKPGEYPYTKGLTIQQAVATAGGFTYRANTRRVAIKHAMETGEHSLELRTPEPIRVEPGDTIRVLERFF